MKISSLQPWNVVRVSHTKVLFIMGTNTNIANHKGIDYIYQITIWGVLLNSKYIYILRKRASYSFRQGIDATDTVGNWVSLIWEK